MLSEELVRKVRLIELSTRKVVDDVLTGQYKSHFKGHGVQFSEHRVYVPGDDVRHIDWKVSARTRDPLVKKYEEERQLSVFLVVDISGSQHFGSQEKLKSEVIAEVGAMLAYAATHTGDEVGVLLFAGQVEKIIPPRKGRNHVLRIIQDLLTYRPKTSGTNLRGAIESASRMMKHSGIVFVLSDFIAEDFSVPLRRLARKHDVVAIEISDPREADLPNLGKLQILDPESGKEVVVDSSSYAFRKWFEGFQVDSWGYRQNLWKGNRIDTLRVDTSGNHADAVVHFFKTRSKKKKR